MPPGPLSYKGQVAVPSINKTFPPATSFNDFAVPTIWTDTANENSYILVSKAQGVANWVLIGGMPGDIATLTGNSGGAVPPLAGNISVTGNNTTGINIVGNPTLGTLTVSGIESSSTQIGTTRFATNAEAAANSLSTVALTPSDVTSLFSVTPLPVAQGGTSSSSFTAYSVITGGTTSTGPLQSVASIGTSGQFLTSNGAAALPSWKTYSIARQVITSTGTYTPTAGMKYCDVEVVGGGGGGGGTGATGADTVAAAGAGGGGGYSRKIFTAATIGVSQAVTIGAGGTAAPASNTTGGTGGTTSFGALISATGGNGGFGTAASGSSGGIATSGGFGGAGSGGDFNTFGNSGGTGIAFFFASGSFACMGLGGSSFFGGGSQPATLSSGGTQGTAGTSYGGGGGGGIAGINQAAQAGGSGAPGVVVITEYVIS